MSVGLTALERCWLQVVQEMKVLQPVPDIRPWVEGQRIPIPAQHNRKAASEGRCWEFGQFPILADWVFDFVKNPATELLFSDGVRRTVTNRTSAILKDSQSGCTSIALHCLAWWFSFLGGNVILITDCRQQARDFAKDRLLNVLDAYPSLRGGKDENDSTSLAIRYTKGTLYMGGGQGASEVVSKPASFTLADEVAKHALINGMPSLKLLEGRITGDDDGKQLAFSTPDNALEYVLNPTTGRMEPMVTQETVIHSSYLQGTQEKVEVPCPHCGHYQELKFEQLRFNHCKESLPGMPKPIWNKERILRETWLQCQNPDCTDRDEKGDTRGRIEESAKPWMVEHRRIVATNLSYKPGHRTLQVGALLNLAFASRTWGAIANAFLSASEEGGEAPMKAFYTDILGLPFARFQAQAENLEPLRKLRRGYRRTGWDGVPMHRVPLETEAIKFLACTADVQRGVGNESGDIGAIKFLFWAADWQGALYVLDWGAVPSLEAFAELIEDRRYSAKDDPENHWMTVDVVCMDSGYNKDQVYKFCALQGGSRGIPRWCAIRGKHTIHDKIARVKPRWTKQYDAFDALGNPTLLRVININADHWEHELHIERFAKAGTDKMTRPPIHLPNDTPDEVLSEMSNAEQYYTKPDRSGLRELMWRKRDLNKPNDYADLLKYALAVINAVEEDEETQV